MQENISAGTLSMENIDALLVLHHAVLEEMQRAESTASAQSASADDWQEAIDALQFEYNTNPGESVPVTEYPAQAFITQAAPQPEHNISPGDGAAAQESAAQTVVQHDFARQQRSAAQPPKAEMTEKQLRILSRKHLLLMVLDLTRELEQAKEENEKLYLAYQAGLAQTQTSE